MVNGLLYCFIFSRNFTTFFSTPKKIEVNLSEETTLILKTPNCPGLVGKKEGSGVKGHS